MNKETFVFLAAAIILVLYCIAYPIIARSNKPVKPMYSVYTVQNGFITDNFITTDPDTAVTEEMAFWSKRHITETQWIVNRLK